MANVTLPNGITIEYERRGSGEPLLLVMGLGGQLIDWPPEFVDTLIDAGFEVISYDNRDIGLSSMTDWTPPSQLRSVAAMIARRPLQGVGYTIDDMADDAAALLDALDLDDAHLVGMSMGGMIAQALTIRHPQRVRSLTSIMSNTGDRRNGGIAWKLVRAMRRPRPITRDNAADEAVRLWRHISGDHFDEADVRTRVAADLARSFSPQGALRQSAAIAGSPDRTDGLRSVTAPTLVVHGLQDLLVKPSGGTATAAAVPGARLLMFPDMGHNLPLPRHREMVDAIAANARRADTLTPA